MAFSSSAAAQNWSFDARAIALGSAGGGGNIAVDMVDAERPYRAIVLPFGLIQVLGDIERFDPGSDNFDIVRAVEYTASPLHFIVDRNQGDTGTQFINDITNLRLNRDLNVYRGFVPTNEVRAEGLANPSWGGTIKFAENPNGAFHGVYIGAGPYLSSQTSGFIDPALTDLLASPTPVSFPNRSFTITDSTATQLALAITGGYRGRYVWDAAGGEADGLYVGVNYHYLRGFRYEDFDLGLRLDTDRNGLLTINPAAGSPISIGRTKSTSGNGFAVDVGAAAVLGPLELGVGINGIGNRIDWTGLERTTFSQTSLFSGGEFIEFPAVPVGDVRVELPVDVRATVRYSTEVSSVVAEYASGFNGTSFRGGVEQRVGAIFLRGGARYIREQLEPTGGIGVNFTDRVGLDVAAFSTSANIERERKLGIAVSLRLMRDND